jgi:hypothetical protein
MDGLTVNETVSIAVYSDVTGGRAVHAFAPIRRLLFAFAL